MEASPTPPPPPPPAAPAAKRIGVGDVINETFSVYRDNVGVLLGGAIAVFVVIGIVSGLAQNAGGVVLNLIAFLLELAGYALFTGFVVKLVQDVRDGRRDQTVGDLFESAMPAILSLVAFGILFGLAVGIGLVLLIVPGLILLTFWSVGAPSIVVEDEGPIGAFGRSWNLVRGEAWSVFGVLVIVFVIVVLIGAVLAAIANPIGDGEVSTLVASVISNVITAPIYALAASVLFFDLGGGSPGTPAPQAAAPPPPPPPPSA